MVDLKRRLTIVERAMRTSHRGIFRVVCVNDPDGMSEDDAQAGEHTYRRLPRRSRPSAHAPAPTLRPTELRQFFSVMGRQLKEN